MKRYDAIIIGFGKGGKTLAADLAGRGWQVALIERSDRMYGGTCINIGCIPSKGLIYKAKLLQCCGEVTFDRKEDYYRRSVEWKEKITAELRARNYNSLDSLENITLYTGVGSFVSPEEIEVKTAAETIRLTADHIFINTGADTVLPAIEGLEDSRRVYTSTTLMELRELPRRLTIIGGGYIGLEFASMYASFGSRVTVLESKPGLMMREDRDMADCVKEVLEKKGIVFKMGVKASAVYDLEKTARAVYRPVAGGAEEMVEAEAILVAVGRKPYTEGLHPELAGIRLSEEGAIVVDSRLHTTCPNVWAMGDVKGGPQFTYVSLDDYRIVREDLFGEHRRTVAGREPVSYTVFIDPPLSRVGMNEEEARRKQLNIRVKKMRVADIPRTRILDEAEGMLKAVVDADTNRILGCTLFCPQSAEMINTVALAIKAGLDARYMRDFVYTHPTMSEAFNILLDV